LEALGIDGGITMYRQEPRVVRKSRDGGAVRRGQIGGEKYVEQRAKTTAIIPDLEVAVGKVRPFHDIFQLKLVYQSRCVVRCLP
jgi:hypothetical protein